MLSCAPLFSVKDSKMYVTIYAIPLKLKKISLLWGKQGKQNVIFLFGKHYLLFGGFFVSIIFLSVYLKVHAVLITVSLWFHNRNISQIFYLSFWGNISNVATCIFESLKSLVSWFCLLASRAGIPRVTWIASLWEGNFFLPSKEDRHIYGDHHMMDERW